MNIRPPKRRLRQLTAFVLMLHLSVVQAMAASGEFHEHCHGHEHDPAHECAVTLMLHGGYDVVTPAIVPVDFLPEPPRLPVVLPPASGALPFHLVGGVLAHAPPRGP